MFECRLYNRLNEAAEIKQDGQIQNLRKYTHTHSRTGTRTVRQTDITQNSDQMKRPNDKQM